MGNCFKGLGLIYEMGQDGILIAQQAGVQLGFLFQFGVFSYIMTAIISRSVSYIDF
jgi:hypothetical protein